MLIASSDGDGALGCELSVPDGFDLLDESMGGYVFEASPEHADRIIETMEARNAFTGTLDGSGTLAVGTLGIPVSKLCDAFFGTLDW